MQNEEIVARLRSAGVPREAFSTTLVKERCQELRDYVENGGYKDKSILYFYGVEAELPFYLTAKELVLAGHSVFCCSLVDIHTALFSDDDDSFSGPLNAANFVAINGFYDVGGRSEPFYTPYESAYFASWLVRNHQGGKRFLLLGNEELSLASSWWPATFVRYIAKRSLQYAHKTRKVTAHE